MLAHELTHVVQQNGGETLLQRLSFSNNGVDFDFDTINMTQPCFNSGPGRVEIDPVRNIAAMSRRSSQQWLRFYSGSPAREARPCAWRFTPEYTFSFQSGSAAQQAGHHIGFIQTVENIRFEAHYQNLSPFVLNVSDSRDAMTSSVPAPWYNFLNQHSGPVDLWTSQNSPEIEDMPTAIFRIWGHQSQQQNPLNSVNASGTFNIWLVVKHQNDPGNQESSLSFLYNISVNYSRSWNYQGSMPYDRGNPSSWSGIGSQQIVSQGERRGSSIPVLSNLIARERLNQQVDAFQFPGP